VTLSTSDLFAVAFWAFMGIFFTSLGLAVITGDFRWGQAALPILVFAGITAAAGVWTERTEASVTKAKEAGAP
jgi:hypothetical protein